MCSVCVNNRLFGESVHFSMLVNNNWTHFSVVLYYKMNLAALTKVWSLLFLQEMELTEPSDASCVFV